MKWVQPSIKIKLKVKLGQLAYAPTTEGLILLSHLWHSKKPNAQSLNALHHHDDKNPEGEKKKKDLAAGGAKPSAPFPLSKKLLSTPSLCHVSPPSRLGRDPVTFEWPIKRRGSVRAPPLGSVQARHR